MNREEAVEKSIELWTWLAETGLKKSKWPGWDEGQVISQCFLCEYSANENRDVDCSVCPYFKHFGHKCFIIRSAYDKWENGQRKSTMKRNATLFLEQLKSLEV